MAVNKQQMEDPKDECSRFRHSCEAQFYKENEGGEFVPFLEMIGSKELFLVVMGVVIVHGGPDGSHPNDKEHADQCKVQRYA
jgi:hypothetical protein